MAKPSPTPNTKAATAGAFKNVTSADFDPQRGVIGLDHARSAVSILRRAEPRSCAFVIAPRTSLHAETLRSLLAEEAAALPARDGVVIVARFEGVGGFDVLRMPPSDAGLLADDVAGVIAMLSATLPAAFESDSYRVARIALDEELRSGHDSALVVLRRKAQAQNIGLLRTTNGYAVVPMHDGRVVRGEIYGALPGSLKTDVEAKLATFEAELAEVLKQRASLQQAHYRRAKDLERDASALAVDAAIRPLLARFAARADVMAWLHTLRTDLINNALLFVAAYREANGASRAPIEIATDGRLQRYRVNVLSRGGRGQSGLELPETLDRAELLGSLQSGAPGAVAPDAVVPGALTRPGGGLIAIDVRDLMANYAAWPLIKHTLKAALGAPVILGDGGLVRAATFDLPVDVRVVVTGELEDYRSWCRLDPDVSRLLRVIEAFQSTLPTGLATERLVARHLAGFIKDDRILPFDGAALAVVYEALCFERGGQSLVSADLEAARDLMGLASAQAVTAGRVMVLSDDVIAAVQMRPFLAASQREPVA